MRAAVLGVCHPDALAHWVQASTRVTHTDPQTEAGSVLVAVAASLAASREAAALDPGGFLDAAVNQCPDCLRDSDLIANLRTACAAFAAGRSVAELAADLGLRRGVTGYIAHTVPVAVFAFLRHPDDYRTAVESVIRCGGDTDTVAAITGALVGARVGKAGIPPEWLSRYADWPRSAAWIERLGRRLAEGTWRAAPQPAVPLACWAIPLRNLFFFLVVLAHVGRRLLPPY